MIHLIASKTQPIPLVYESNTRQEGKVALGISLTAAHTHDTVGYANTRGTYPFTVYREGLLLPEPLLSPLPPFPLRRVSEKALTCGRGGILSLSHRFGEYSTGKSILRTKLPIL